MTAEKPSVLRQWIRRGFVVWAIVSTAWLLNTFRTQGVPSEVLAGSPRVAVESSRELLAFRPTPSSRRAGLAFLVGGGVAAEAYAPLLRPLADSGYAVFVVRLPYRLAPLESHKRVAVDRVRTLVRDNGTVDRWVIAGHSLGGALASRLVAEEVLGVSALILIGTSHPKTINLSQSPIAITKIVATNDGVATVEMVDETRHLLPADTDWVVIEGGNHSQFGHFGHMLFDGTAAIGREQQQDMTRSVLLRALEAAAGDDA